MPAFDPDKKAALLGRAVEGVRRICCTEITSCDILPLLSGDEKLGGTLIDAILKKYQRLKDAPIGLEEISFFFRTSRDNLCPSQKFDYLRVILGDFPDTKYWELPGACSSQ